MKVVNLTQHEINFANDNGDIIMTFPPSGTIARVSSKQKKVDKNYPVPVFKTEFGDIENLPEPAEETVYLVSTLIAQAAKRVDVISPITDNTAIRNEKGQVIAVRGFQTF